MNLFFDLPQTHQVMLVTTWLQLIDVVFLDSAICSQKHRSDFLNCLRSRECVFPLADLCVGMDAWLINRCVAVSILNMKLHQLHQALNVKKVMGISGHALQNLSVEMSPFDKNVCPFDSILRWIAGYCPVLTELKIDSVTLDASLAHLLHQSHTLQSISINNCMGLIFVIFQACCESSSLSTLTIRAGNYSSTEYNRFTTQPGLNHTCTEFSISGYSVPDHVKVAMCSSFANLSTLYLILNNAHSLVTIAEHCNLVSDCEVSVSVPLSLEAAEKIVKYWTQIINLSIICDEDEEKDVCSEDVVMLFVKQCHTLEVLRLAPLHERFGPNRRGECTEPPTSRSVSSEKRSNLLELCVPCLSENSLIYLVENCPLVHTLCISHCVNNLMAARGSTAEQHLHHINNSGITTLCLVNCVVLTEPVLYGLVHLKQLLICNDQFPWTVDAGALAKALSTCTSLQSLYVHATVDPSFILLALEVCPKLTSFDLGIFTSGMEDNPTDAVYGMISVLEQLVQEKYPLLEHFQVYL